MVIHVTCTELVADSLTDNDWFVYANGDISDLLKICSCKESCGRVDHQLVWCLLRNHELVTTFIKLIGSREEIPSKFHSSPVYLWKNGNGLGPPTNTVPEKEEVWWFEVQGVLDTKNRKYCDTHDDSSQAASKTHQKLPHQDQYTNSLRKASL
ncbi:hypothetical protein Bca52824_017541 [Brassica carinata]|uniref:Uncharacterized protein n=1 Tax=Brassica carinata TaxID=52824 RepID=A0A8X7VNE7_BRACI|nr:hypothetical protein Bca52824_017541 [Brassica carinata]